MTGNGHGNAEGRRNPIRILVADSDADHRNTLKNVLSDPAAFDVVALVGDGERASRLAAQLQPEVTVLESGMARADGTSTAESIALTVPHCQLIMMSVNSDPAMIRQAMQVGAREFLSKPVDSDQLIQAINRVYEFVSRRQAASVDETARVAVSPAASKVFAVWGPKGGVGRTFLAVNLAVAMAATEGRRVLLMDGCLGFCTADVALDIEGSKTIFDLVVEHDEDLDPDLVEQVVVHHVSGIDVLLAPHVEHMLLLAPAQLQRILRVMRRMYDYVVIDTRPLLDETTVAFLDLSDVILTVCAPEIASLRNLRVFLDAASHLGYSSSKIQLILNRFDMRGAITQAEIERVCRCRVTFCIPNDHEAVSGSINQGKPLVTLQPNRPISKEIMSLAALLAGNRGVSQPSDGKSRKLMFGRLFGQGAAR